MPILRPETLGAFCFQSSVVIVAFTTLSSEYSVHSEGVRLMSVRHETVRLMSVYERKKYRPSTKKLNFRSSGKSYKKHAIITTN